MTLTAIELIAVRGVDHETLREHRAGDPEADFLQHLHPGDSIEASDGTTFRVVARRFVVEEDGVRLKIYGEQHGEARSEATSA